MSKDAPKEQITPNSAPSKSVSIGAYLLVGLGVLFLLHNFVSWFRLDRIWPVILIGIGVMMLTKSNRGQEK